MTETKQKQPLPPTVASVAAVISSHRRQRETNVLFQLFCNIHQHSGLYSPLATGIKHGFHRPNSDVCGIHPPLKVLPNTVVSHCTLTISVFLPSSGYDYIFLQSWHLDGYCQITLIWVVSTTRIYSLFSRHCFFEADSHRDIVVHCTLYFL